jgi:hypothetical protein
LGEGSSVIPGVEPRFEAGADEHLAGDPGTEFPVASNQWLAVAEFLRQARGVVLHKLEVVRPLWLILRNTTDGPIPVAWVSYCIKLRTDLSPTSYEIAGNLPLESLTAGAETKVAMLDLSNWDSVKAEVTAVTATPPTDPPSTDTKSEATLTCEPVPADLRVVAYCPTGASFSQSAEVTFHLPEDKAKVRFRHASARETRCINRYHGLPGLLAVIDLPRRSGNLLQHAFQATALCDGVVSTAFALTLADMRECFPVQIIDATPGLTDRPFMNFFVDQAIMGRRAHLDPADWSAKATTMLEKTSKRVGRAMRWLRKMHTEDDILDRFLAGWAGLETLNPELCTHFDVQDSAEEVLDCACGRKLVRNVPRANGLKELFIREGKQAVYSKCSRARNGLVHGFETIAEVTAVARSYTSDVGFILARGIQLLSGIPVPTEPDKFTWLNGFRVASLLFFEGTMRCGEVDAYEKSHNEMPLCEFAVRHEGEIVDEKTVLHGSANIRLPPDCTVTPKGMGILGAAKVADLQVE